MKKGIKIILHILIINLLITSCKESVKTNHESTADLESQLEKLKSSKAKLEEDINKLQDKLSKADSTKTQTSAKLIGTSNVLVQDFAHYIELQGKVDAEGIGYVAPKGMGGLVKNIFVKAGDKVSHGQLLLKLDDVLARQQLTGAEQQTGTIKARLTQAQTIYQRVQNLWKQGIGMELNVINAKADVDALAAQLKASQSQVGVAQEQVNMANVYAQMSGVVDVMSVRVGQLFTPQTAADPRAGSYIRIVNGNNLKIVTNVPENYTSVVKKGAKVLITVSEAKKEAIPAIINVVGAYIDPTTRSFITECKIAPDAQLKPNQTATMKILDYEQKNATIIPVNIVQSDDKGKYVYVMIKEGNKKIAQKKAVTIDDKHMYDGKVQVLTGLTGDDIVITEGYQSVYEGQLVETNN